MFLQDAQKLGLHVRANVTDLIKKAGAALSFLKQSSFIRNRSGKCSPHMAEQFAFEERLAERAAVHGHKWAARPGTMLVNGLSNQLLAGAAFSENQHRAFSGSDSSDCLIHFHHDGGFADDRPWLLRVFSFFSACAFSILDCALRQRSGHSLFELLQIHGLGDKIKSSFMNRLDGGFYRAKSGHHDDGKRGMFLM